MNKFFYCILFLLPVSFLFANEADVAFEKFKNPKQCLSCHKDQALDWETTWHSRSHYDSNSLYKASVDYVSQVTYSSIDNVLIKCGQCHNPKMSLKRIEDMQSYVLADALNLETNQVKNIKTSVNDENLKSGISCVICHSVDKIHESKDLKARGYEAVEWSKNNTILGPYGDESRAGFHKSEKREHFTDSNKLCMVCHYGGINDNNVKIYATGEEYDQSKDNQKCADCHMSTYKQGFIVPQIVREGKTPVLRDLRSHLFAGARNSDIMKTAFDVELQQKGRELIINIKNTTPHNAPTGFGGRSIELKVQFFDVNNDLIDTKAHDFEAIFIDKNGKETLSYIAKSIKSDDRFKAFEKKSVAITKPYGASSAKIELNYRLVNKRLIDILEISDPVFTESYPIFSQTIKF